MTVRELLDELGITITIYDDMNTEELNYDIVLRELKSDFKYKYTAINFETRDTELKTIIIKKEL